MPTERAILRECLLALSREADVVVWRNETAGAWVGRHVRNDGVFTILRDARHLTFGLARGSADIIGVGPGGRFLALECKTETGRLTAEQARFLDVVRAAGGIAAVVRSGADAVNVIETERQVVCRGS